jgi:hypothetical protein
MPCAIPQESIVIQKTYKWIRPAPRASGLRWKRQCCVPFSYEQRQKNAMCSGASEKKSIYNPLYIYAICSDASEKKSIYNPLYIYAICSGASKKNLCITLFIYMPYAVVPLEKPTHNPIYMLYAVVPLKTNRPHSI